MNNQPTGNRLDNFIRSYGTTLPKMYRLTPYLQETNIYFVLSVIEPTTKTLYLSTTLLIPILPKLFLVYSLATSVKS
jgi:hypothetical protein